MSETKFSPQQTNYNPQNALRQPAEQITHDKLQSVQVTSQISQPRQVGRIVKMTLLLFAILMICAILAVISREKQVVEAENIKGVFTETYGILPLAANKVYSIPSKKSHPTALPQLSARAYLAHDLNSGSELAGKNTNSVLPIASLTKLMTAIVVYKNADLKNLVTIQQQDIETASFVAGFAPGEKVSVRDLLNAMLVSSANDATLALSRSVFGSTKEFVEAMNREAAAYNMGSTSFANPVGFDDERQYSTADDMAKLVREFIRYHELMEIVSMKEVVISAENTDSSYPLVTTNKLMSMIPDIVGLKTGYTSEARGNLILLVNERYYTIVLGSQDREKDSLSLMRYLDNNFIWNK